MKIYHQKRICSISFLIIGCKGKHFLLIIQQNLAQAITEKFFQLLRGAIGAGNDEATVEVSPEDWEQIYRIARQQSLLGVLFYGIQRCAEVKPERKLLLKWYSLSEKIKQGNMKANRAAVELTEFFRREGFRSCVLKGQGNTLNYPAPHVRTSGDIDLWVEGGAEVVLAFARRFVPGSKFCYHHIEFRKVDGVETEVHYRPSFMNNLVHNWRMQRWFDEVADEQFRHEVELPEGAGRVCVPTHGFNRIYQMSHISNHVFHEGIGLRQIVDYYFVLRQGFTEEERLRDERLLRRLGLYDMAAAVMYVLQTTLHLGEELMIVPANRRLGTFLLNELLEGGNFGRYDQRVGHSRSAWAKNVRRLRRDVRMMWYFPSECLWEPVFRWFHFFWRVRYR